MRPFATLRGRLLLVVVGALVPLLGFFLLGRSQLTEQAQAEWRDNAVRLAGIASATHAEVLRETEWLLSALSHVPSLRSLDPSACEAIFEEFYRSRSYYTAFGLVRTDGVTACTFPDVEAMDLSGRPYLQEALRTRRLAVSDYHLGAITGRPVVTMALPVLNADSTVVAVLAAGLDLSRIPPLPPEVAMPRGAHLTLADRTGHVLYHAPDAVPQPGDRVPAQVARLVGAVSTDTVAELVVEGSPRTFAVEPVELAGADLGAWVIVSFAPAAVAARIDQIARSALVGVAVAAVLLLAGLWVAVEFLVLRRIAPIVAASARLGRGELGARSGVGGADDEIGRLGRAFDEMAASLEEAREAEAEWARTQVERSEKRLRLLAETIDEVFWIWDPDEQTYVYLSPAFEDIWGISRARLLEDPSIWLETMHPDDRDRIRERMVDSGSLREGEHEYRIRRPDGEERWISSRTFAVRNEEGEVERYLGVAQDITERKVLEDALLQASKLEAVGRLAGGVAHDFNNVLTAIQGHAQFMEETLPAEHPVREDLAQISVGVKRAAGLTRQLLTFSRKQAVSPTILDLSRVVEDTVAMLERLIGEDMRLVLDLGRNLPPVEADVHQIEQVLVNLAVNARDAMPDGGTLTIGTLRASVEDTEALTSDVLLPGEYAVLRVEDTGHGIAPKVMDHLFEPFFTTKPVGEGTGLGLATVYGIVKQSGGSIRVESREGEGATFLVYLPESGEPSPAREEPEEPGESISRSHRVLLVEDEEPVRVVTERMLRNLGCEVWSAASGAEALVLATSGADVDVLITDVVMPGMNGLELHRRLRDAGRELPVVFMSGYPGFGMEDESPVEEHVFLQKPFTAVEVARAMEEARAKAERPLG